MKLVIYTDGGARGNPGPAGIGVVIKNDKHERLSEFAEYIGTATNNVAEYRALILALRQAYELHASSLDIFMDSELIVKQMKGLYKIKEPTLQVLATEVIRLVKHFQTVSFTHIPRHLNKEADRLVNSAIDAAI